MANIKISELTSETELSENHIVITEQENATETKKSTLGLIFDWIVGKLPIATADKAGNIKSGGDITVGTNGVVTVNSVGGKTVNADVPEDAVFTDTVYELPIASNTVLGGIKIDGSTITVDESGVASSHNGIKVSPTLTLTADGWVDNVQTVEIALNTNNRIVVDETFGEQPTWRECGVYPSSVTETGITFTCITTPTSDLTFKVTSFVI